MTSALPPRVAYLIEAAFALVAGWETRPIPRAQWHRADDYLVSAALICDDARVMEAWERLALQYERSEQWSVVSG